MCRQDAGEKKRSPVCSARRSSDRRHAVLRLPPRHWTLPGGVQGGEWRPKEVRSIVARKEVQGS
ncbi:hypothetical protein EYF80_046172 [Liparis tanakae]|uniref:Uncharacterized protein n=1 Tax=Liparis tanakae TaxID=230148 RepID=A0A4Z2FR61_9TELE|nr:hypothetical protein EYF80_046172 [Liparis tanakae]